ncbi:MAG: pentapeptide repeat-containing protein [Chloroflexota bacterium]|nr:pentapeptide repeat-containing protein [Chloroflexota bacterium]
MTREHDQIGAASSATPLTRVDVELLRNNVESPARLDLSFRNLQHIDLSYIDLQGANLRGANLQGANLRGTTLSDTDLQATDLSNADLDGADLSRAHLGDSAANRVDLRQAKLSYATLRELDLHGFDLTGLDLSNADLNGTNLRDAILHETDLCGADLSTAQLHGPELRGAILYRGTFPDDRLKRDQQVIPIQEHEIGSSMMIPRDDFTPHGYLDNPYHSWKLNPSGVLRSLAPLGMGWHVPNLGSYTRNQFQYSAHLMIGVRINDLVLVTAEDFQNHGCTINSQLHSSQRFEYTCIVPEYDLTLTARYFLVHEHALGCILSVSTSAARPLSVTCYLVHQHTHNPATSRLWEHGLYARSLLGGSCAMLGLASEGDVFIHGVQAADHGATLSFGEMGYATSLADISAWAHGKSITRPGITQYEAETGWQVRTVALPCAIDLGGASEPQERILDVVLARGVSLDQAYAHWRDGIEGIAGAEAAHHAADARFWRQAPQLSGDWPASWRRGFVYDHETLRMTIRPPAGVLQTSWDGMQIQAPRTVLAEAAMDMLFLSYADPELAAEVILGHFTSAPHPNLPCMREDGSYNMVADDGQICGTAPEWGFPLWCCDQIFRRTGDLHWLRRLYPGAAAYLRWWLEHRRDSEGYLIYNCSWESGQDVSTRFGPQQTGGTIIQHVRPVDLQASMMQGAEILAHWSTLLAGAAPEEDERGSTQDMATHYSTEAAWWRNVAHEFSTKTRQMWHDGWFRDYDSVAHEWSDQRDAMHLAAIFCGAAGWSDEEQLRAALAQAPWHSEHWAPLCWPPVVMTLIGAVAAAAMPAEAAELAYGFIDASYRSIDKRRPDEHGGLPGVTREYRRVVANGPPIEYENAGIEGYGWGALSIHLLMRYLLGLREEEAGMLTIAPMLPQALRRTGASYRVGPVQWGKYVLAIEFLVQDAQSYLVRLHCAEHQREETVWAAERVQQLPGAVQKSEWTGTWGEERTLLLPQLSPRSPR